MSEDKIGHLGGEFNSDREVGYKVNSLLAEAGA